MIFFHDFLLLFINHFYFMIYSHEKNILVRSRWWWWWRSWWWYENLTEKRRKEIQHRLTLVSVVVVVVVHMIMSLWQQWSWSILWNSIIQLFFFQRNMIIFNKNNNNNKINKSIEKIIIFFAQYSWQNLLNHVDNHVNKWMIIKYFILVNQLYHIHSLIDIDIYTK